MACALSGVGVDGQVDPSNLQLTHLDNRRQLVVSFDAGILNGGAGGCKLQISVDGGGYQDLTLFDFNCDEDLSAAPIWLPSPFVPWSSVAVRLVNAFSQVVGVFPETVDCVPTAGSRVSTPEVDEDCNGNWNNSAPLVERARVYCDHPACGTMCNIFTSCADVTCSEGVCTDFRYLDSTGCAAGTHNWEAWCEVNTTQYF